MENRLNKEQSSNQVLGYDTKTSFGYGRRSRQRLVQQNQVKDTTRKSRQRIITTEIVEDRFLPVIVRDCREGNVTTKGTNMIIFDWQHLVSKESFSTAVFENVGPNGMDRQLFKAILLEEFGKPFYLEDLINGGVFIKLKFNIKNDKTYMNIVDVKPLDAKHQALLQEILVTEQQEKQHTTDEINRFENELYEMNLHDPFSHRPNKEKLNDDEYEIDKNDRDDKQIDEVDIDDVHDLDLDIDDEDLNFDDDDYDLEDGEEEDEYDSDYNSSRKYY